MNGVQVAGRAEVGRRVLARDDGAAWLAEVKRMWRVGEMGWHVSLQPVSLASRWVARGEKRKALRMKPVFFGLSSRKDQSVIGYASWWSQGAWCGWREPGQ